MEADCKMRNPTCLQCAEMEQMQVWFLATPVFVFCVHVCVCVSWYWAVVRVWVECTQQRRTGHWSNDIMKSGLHTNPCSLSLTIIFSFNSVQVNPSSCRWDTHENRWNNQCCGTECRNSTFNICVWIGGDSIGNSSESVRSTDRWIQGPLVASDVLQNVSDYCINSVM